MRTLISLRGSSVHVAAISNLHFAIARVIEADGLVHHTFRMG
jgi:hypothetical protein